MSVKWLLRGLSILPLPILHAIGSLGGRLVYRFDKRYRARLQHNATLAGFDTPKFWNAAAAHMGRGVLELAHIWTPRVDQLLKNVKVTGWDDILAAKAKGKGVIILTPHIGAFELLSLWIGQYELLTAMYRPPKQPYIADAMLEGRQKFKVKMASADVKGIRTILRALKNGELVGLLPDQVPGSKGEAVVAKVFGAPALTMTLPAKLIKQTDAVLATAFTRRVSGAHRYEIEFTVVDFEASGEPVDDANRINDLLADAIYSEPEQYLWGYNRYKNVNSTLGKMDVVV